MPCRKFEKEYKIEKNAIPGPKSKKGYPLIKVEYTVSSLALAYRALPFVDILYSSFSKHQILSHAPSHLNVSPLAPCANSGKSVTKIKVTARKSY